MRCHKIAKFRVADSTDSHELNRIFANTVFARFVALAQIFFKQTQHRALIQTGSYSSKGACYSQSKISGLHKNYGIFEDKCQFIPVKHKLFTSYENSLILPVVYMINKKQQIMRRECYLPALKIQQRCDKSASYFLLFSTTEKSAFTWGGYSSTGPYLFLCSVHTGGYSNWPLIKIGR